VPSARTSPEACLAGWPNAQPQGWDKCSVARHHACLTVCVCEVSMLRDLSHFLVMDSADPLEDVFAAPSDSCF